MSSPPLPQHQLVELTDVPTDRLADPHQLAAVLIAAAGAMGLSTLGVPVTRHHPDGAVAILMARGGHIVLHAERTTGRCLVDIMVPASLAGGRGLEVIGRRLGAGRVEPLG